MSEISVDDSILCQADKQAAFIVRAHHALNLYRVLGQGFTIDETLERGRSQSFDQRNQEIALDTYGSNNTEVESTIGRLKTFFEAFMNLPDTAIVRMSANEKDGFCHACSIGAHCNTFDPGEKTFLTATEAVARKHGLSPNLNASADKTSLELPAWAARQILSDIGWSSHLYTFPPDVWLQRWLAQRQIHKNIKRRS